MCPLRTEFLEGGKRIKQPTEAEIDVIRRNRGKMLKTLYLCVKSGSDSAVRIGIAMSTWTVFQENLFRYFQNLIWYTVPVFCFQ